MSKQKQFKDHIADALKERNMIPADLARETGMDSGAISNILSGKRPNPSPETCKLIAKALDFPLEMIYRWAEILPEKEEVDSVSEVILHLVLELDTDEKRNVLEYVRLRHRIWKEKGNVPDRGSRKTATGKTASV